MINKINKFLCLNFGRIIIASILVLISPFGYAQKASPESDVRDEAKQLFNQGRFEDLNRLSLKYLSSQEKLANGIWKFSEIYEGIDLAMSPPDHLKSIAELDKHWNSIQRKLDRWLQISRSSAIANISKSHAYTSQAWSYRGTGLSGSVKEDSWTLFRQNIEKSKLNLLSIRNIAIKDPYWYCEMIVVGKAEGWGNDDFFKIFNEGVARHPTFYPLYSYASSKLLPQWGGSIEEIVKFAAFAAENSKNKEGKSFYARVLWSAYQSRLPDSFIKNEKTWLSMKSSFNDLIATYPDPWNLYAYARFSCMAGDRENLKRIIDLIGKSDEDDQDIGPPVNPWGKDYFSKCRIWANNSSQ